MRDIKKGKLGWTESSKLHSTFKRSMVNSDTINISKDKSKQHKAVCGKCGIKFSIRGDRKPKHYRTYDKDILNEEGIYIKELITEVCDGDIIKEGNEEIDSHTYKITSKTSTYVLKSFDVTIKKGDKIVAEIRKYSNGNIESDLVEKTIKSIYKNVEIGIFGGVKTNVIIKCTDGTLLPSYVRDIYIIK